MFPHFHSPPGSSRSHFQTLPKSPIKHRKMKNPIRLISTAIGAARTFSTAAKEEIKPSSVSSTLYRRLSALGITGRSVTETVNQYQSEGNPMRKSLIIGCVRELSKYGQYRHALELMEWMEKGGKAFTHSDYAVYINLLAQTRGIDSAEHYFNNLPPPAKKKTYGILLNCFCKKKRKEKALALFAEMKEINVASTSLNYNSLMILFMNIGEPEKVPHLVQEMKEKGLPPTTYTYNILINCFGTLKDFDGAEGVLEEMKTNDSNKCDWTTYSNMAAMYVKAGLFEKAESTLKETEKYMKSGDRKRMAYHFLISLYAGTSNSSEVYRVWNSLKSAFPSTTNKSYLTMLQALAKLDDFEGLKKCFQEWESGSSSYDIGLANVLLSAYLKRGMIKEAQLLFEDAMQKGSRRKYTTYKVFVDFFLMNRQLSMALRVLEAGVSTLEGKQWKLDREMVSAFLKLIKEEKDEACAEKFGKMLMGAMVRDRDIECLSLPTDTTGEVESESDTCQMIKVDAIEMSPEIEELVEKICQA